MANRLTQFGVAFLIALASIGTQAEETRKHQVREGMVGQALGDVTEYELPAVGLGRTDEKAASKTQPKTSAGASDFEIAAVDVSLTGDYDGDGYFHVIDLDWDADTVFVSADVYGVVFLSYEGGPWEEFLTTATYTISGTSSADRYRVESDLESGYPTGTYDVLLELYDPDTGEFLASLGPSDTVALAQLPLEDRRRDDDDDYYGGGGAFDKALMLLLLLALFHRVALSRSWAKRGSPRE